MPLDDVVSKELEEEKIETSDAEEGENELEDEGEDDDMKAGDEKAVAFKRYIDRKSRYEALY